MGSPIDVVNQVLDLLPIVVGADWLALGDDEVVELVARIGAVGRLVDAAAVLGAGEIGDRSRRELGTAGLAYRHGQRGGAALVSELTLQFQADAATQVRVGATVRYRTTLLGEVLDPERPRVATAMIAGRLDRDAAAVIVRCLDQANSHNARLEDVDAAEEALVQYAVTSPADLVAIHARVWRDALDPDGILPREEQIRDRRGATLGRERDGISRLVVDCDPVLAAHVREVFGVAGSARKDPVFLDDADLARATTLVTGDDDRQDEVVVDPRTRAQRNHDVLRGIVTAGVTVEGRKAGRFKSPVTVVATIPLKDLLASTGHGYIDGVDEPVTVSTIQELARDSGFQPLILGSSGQPLYLGRTERYFTPAIKLAATVRDGGCVWPSFCPIPASQCDSHHVREWNTDHGPTDIDNCVLLCPFHHHLLHNTGYTLKMVHGRPHLLPPPQVDLDQKWRPLGRSRALPPLGPDTA